MVIFVTLIVLIWVYIGCVAAVSIASAAVGVCLIGGLNPFALLPPIPYWCGALLAISLLALSVLLAAGCIYCAFIMCRFMRAYIRSRHLKPPVTSGKASPPLIAAYPKLTVKQMFQLRKASTTALVVFATCFVSGFIVCAISAGGLGFWHQWNWFV